jgi:hypothetical protein
MTVEGLRRRKHPCPQEQKFFGYFFSKK